MSGEQQQSFLSKAWGFTKSYVMNVGQAYLEFVVPVAIFVVFNAGASSLMNNERSGLMWLNYSQLENEVERETKYPAHEPDTPAHKRRLEAAQTAAAAASV